MANDDAVHASLGTFFFFQWEIIRALTHIHTRTRVHDDNTVKMFYEARNKTQILRDSNVVISNATASVALPNFIHKSAKNLSKNSLCMRLCCACLFLANRRCNTTNNTATNRYDNSIYIWNNFMILKSIFWRHQKCQPFFEFEWATNDFSQSNLNALLVALNAHMLLTFSSIYYLFISFLDTLFYF